MGGERALYAIGSAEIGSFLWNAYEVWSLMGDM